MKKLLLLFLLSAIFAAVDAQAEITEPEAYVKLTAVELSPEKAPRLNDGLMILSLSENQYHEHLPLQLSGAMEKLKKAKYQPKRR